MQDLQYWMQLGRISPEGADRLKRFIDLILEWNARVNLTGFRGRREIETLLIGECIGTISALNLVGRSVLDFGSGAGVPGLVWAACIPSIRVTSVEVRQKKVAFQKEVLRHTGIEAEVLCGRFPEVVSGRRFDLIVTRAIRFEPRLWEEGRDLLNPGGNLVRFAAPGTSAEGWRAIPTSEHTSLLLKP